MCTHIHIDTARTREDICLFFGEEGQACLCLCISKEGHTVHMRECYLCIRSVSVSVQAPDVSRGQSRAALPSPDVSTCGLQFYAKQNLLNDRNR